MRVAEVFKRLLRMEGLKVLAPELVEDEHGRLEAVVIDVARPACRLMRCGGCGYRTRAVYDRSRRTWRHLDLLRVPLPPAG